MPGRTERRALRVRVEGTVQGVGFRPFVYRLAAARRLDGWVRNDPAGVDILAAGPGDRVDDFLRALREEAPPAAVVERILGVPAPGPVPAGFAILDSAKAGEAAAPVSPDLAVCADCLRELFDPADRRHGYPFINCTNCGPRFTILRRVPYDRPNTTMAGFAMCPACRAEYDDPADRRFHAQPNACPACGPQLAWWDGEGRERAVRGDALAAAAAALRDGRLVAVQGLGGFHLMADARNDGAVRELRRRKAREEKPLALMFPDLAAIEAACEVSGLEASLLRGAAAPIVLLARRAGATEIAPSVAPGNPGLGAMRPYTPLHHLLLRALGFPLVATSGNLADEPICIDGGEARRRLAGLADAFLVHNRPIVRPVDDSVVRVIAGREMILRRARGYAPAPIAWPAVGAPVLAVGAHLKNTVALGLRGRVVLSQHIGDLDTAETDRVFRASVEALRGLYDATLVVIAHDRHPDYRSTQFALRQKGRHAAIQHHHAHLAAVMAEHGLDGTVLGVTWDGAGWGGDGTSWGGEFLVGGCASFRRVAHLRAFPLPGGDRAAREPRRAALGLLFAQFGAAAAGEMPEALRDAFTPAERATLLSMLARGVRCPRSSGAGRLFDAVASLCGIRQRASYEGQAAMELEYAAAQGAGAEVGRLAWRAPAGAGPAVVDWAPVLEAILAGRRSGVPAPDLARGFHLALADAIADAAQRAGEARVVLGGGCFANRVLLEATVDRLRAQGHEVFWPHRVPPGDGGLALGQVAAAVAGNAGA